MNRIAIALTAVAVLAGCGDTAEDEAGFTDCSELLVLRSEGDVGDILGNYRRSTLDDNLDPEAPVGEMTTRRIALFLGEVEFTPAGGAPEMRPRLMTIQTNVEERRLLDELSDRKRLFGPDFDVIDKPIDQYCDPAQGELCVRFGLDNTANNELVADTVIHTGVSGTIGVQTVTAGRLRMTFDVDFGPNIQNEFDESGGHLEGCFDARLGDDRAGVVPLDVPCGDDDPRDICNQASE